MRLPSVKIPLHYWPIFSCLWCIASFIITYVIATLNGHVYPFFPYISDTGTNPPESCIFGQLLNLGACLLALTVYLRHHQLNFAINSTEKIIGTSWNISATCLGYTSCLGVSIIANFQETNLLAMHLVGGFLLFGVGTIYFLIQAKITVRFSRVSHSICRPGACLVRLRAVVAVFLVPLFFVTSICSFFSAQQFTGERIEYWTENDGGFALRLTGTFTEWIAVLLMMLFVSTFAIELKSLRLVGAKLELA